MAARADNFAYYMMKRWEIKSVNALEYAKRQGATIFQKVNCIDHWINEPGDQPGYLMQWPDGSRYIVGENGNWIKAPFGAGRRTPTYEIITGDHK